jgi:hypothetical protein
MTPSNPGKMTKQLMRLSWIAAAACLVAMPAAAQARQDSADAGRTRRQAQATPSTTQDPNAPAAPAATRPLPGRAGRAGALPPPDVMNVAQVERFFDGYMVNEARKVLQLTDDQYFTIGPRLERLQELRRQAQRQRRQTLGELREMLRSEAPPDDAALTAKIKAVDDVPAQYAELIRKAYADIDGPLTPKQRARFRTFEEMMEQQKLDLLARARQIRPAGR